MLKHAFRYTILGLLSLVPLLVQAAPVVYGRITDRATGEGLLGVNLQLAQAVRGASSDLSGYYRIRVPAAGTWTLRVTHIGYRTILQDFTVGADDSVEVNVALVSDFLQAEEVVVTAHARESTARLSTTKVEVVGVPDVQERSPGSLDRVLDAVPGVEVHRTGGAVVSNLSIRGSSDMLGGGVGNRTLLLVDGKPAIISDTDGASWWLYPDDVIERVEVVKGAYSALYGSNAMGGVVNLITRTPTHRQFTRIHAVSGLYEKPYPWMRYQERRAALGTLAFSHSNTVGRLGYYANVTRNRSDGWREGSGWDNISAFAKFKYDLTPTRTLTYSTLFLNGENDYPHAWYSSAEPLRIRDIYTNDYQRKRSFSTDLMYSRIESSNSSYTVRAFYNRDLTRSILNPATQPMEENIPVGFETQSLSQKFGIFEQSTRLWAKCNTLVFGVDAVWDEINGEPEDYLYGKQGAFSPAVYAQNDYSPVRQLHFTVGARYDYRHVHSGATTRQLSPKAGLSYELHRDLVVRGSVGHAFRNPSFAEMFLKKVGTQDYEFEPNPDLKPERVNFGEVGANLRIDDYAVVDGGVFYYKYDDIIRWQTLAAGRYQTANLAEAKIKGFEVGVRSAWPRRLKQVASLTYLDTDIDNQGPLTYVPKWRFYYSATVQFGNLLLSGDLRMVSKTDTVVFYQNDAPSAYQLIGLRAAFEFHQNTRLAFIVDNVTNEQYEEMERYRMPPRTYRVELIYEFDVSKQ
ncbi:MAG: TonB-dependent receptor [Calditrichota bacterium]